VKSVAECGALAKEAGMNTFGVQYYGECWTGNNTNWDRYGRLDDRGCGELGSGANNQVYKYN